MNEKETTLSTKEFALQTGLSMATITKMLRSGKISGEKRSGKWKIPKSQLHSNIITNLCKNQPQPATQPAASKHNTGKKVPIKNEFSISEFSEITYLTEFGVKEWLRVGKIKGHQDEEGQWRINADSLQLPTLKHLLRQ